MAAEASAEARAFIAGHRVARLATADVEGAPHVVPICYAYDGRYIYTALDLKPKHVAVRRLKRVRNIESNSSVSVLIDDYSEDWSRLAYVLVQGVAGVLEAGEEQEWAVAMLRNKYPQYGRLLKDDSVVLRITSERVISWGRV